MNEIFLNNFYVKIFFIDSRVIYFIKKNFYLFYKFSNFLIYFHLSFGLAGNVFSST